MKRGIEAGKRSFLAWAAALCLLPGTRAAAETVYQAGFEAGAGAEWSTSSTDVTPSGREFLGQFGNDTAHLSLSDLPEHQYLRVSFDLLVIRSWDGSGENGWGPDVYSVGLTGGATLMQTTFSYPGCRINRQAYPAAYGKGLFAGGTGAAEMDTLGYTFRFPTVTLPLDSVYRLSFTFPHTASSVGLDFGAAGLQEPADESWGLDNVRVETCPPPRGRLAISASSVNVGAPRSGTTAKRSFKLRNTGHGPLTGSVSTVPAPFRVVSGGGEFTLAPRETRTVTVEFAPEQRYRFRDLLVIAADDPRRPRAVVSLSGRGR